MTPPAPDAHGAPERFRVFGGVLAADRPLPGLPVAPLGDGQSSFWELHTTDADVAPIGHSAAATPIGRQPYSNGIEVTLAMGDSGAEIAIADTGLFVLDAAARHVHHVAVPAADRGAVALDLIGTVLPYALHCTGAWCAHASAVQLPAGAVAFLAPRGTGKSTLATACLRAGAALVADDVVVLRQAAGGVTVTPTGLPLRMRIDAARTIGVETVGADGWGKVRVDGIFATGDTPLAALYVLAPAAVDAPVQRARRTTRASALALLAHGKITGLLGTASAGDALERCIGIAGGIPVYDLAVPRDLARLHEVTDALMAWHDGAGGHA